MLCARNESKLTTVATELRGLCNTRQRVEFMCADVSKQEDVARLVSSALTAFPQIHILVNNAGVYGPKGPIDTVDWDEWIRAVGINLFGSILTARALLPHFRAYQYVKIIQLSGCGASSPLPFF